MYGALNESEARFCFKSRPARDLHGNLLDGIRDRPIAVVLKVKERQGALATSPGQEV